MDLRQTIHGPILSPRADGRVEFIFNGAIRCDEQGIIDYIGAADALPASPALASSRKTSNLNLPPFLDAHIHIPQHPIRGRFMEGVGEKPEQGRLLAGLNRNVFPTEAKYRDLANATDVVRDFQSDTLAQGVVGGAAYMNVSAIATDCALRSLGDFWHVG